MNLHERQLELEANAVGLGIDRYRKGLEAQGEAQKTPGMKLIREAIVPLADAIKAFAEEANSGRPGRDIGRAKFLTQFPPQTVAYLTAKVCINAVSAKGQEKPVQGAAMTIATMLEDTLNFDLIKEKEPKVYSRLLNKIKNGSGNGHYQHVIMRNAQNKAKIDTIKWGRSEKLALGLHLIRLLEQVTGYIVLTRATEGRNDTPIYILPTPHIQEWLEKSHAKCELLNPVNMPMVVPPREWQQPYNGGYMTRALSYPLVRARNRNFIEELKNWDMPKVYKAINALQNTGWRINKAVHSVMTEVWASGGMLGGLPPRDDLPLPAQSYTDPEANPEAHREWKRKAAEVYNANQQLRGKRRVMGHKLRIADEFSQYDVMYFPHVMDWRGRVYPVAAYLNPQSDDSGKALLQFSEGKALGDNGAFWLAVHGANCAGVDKVSFEDRVQWVEEHHTEIIDSALSPLDGQRFWAEQDSPYQFLAFCFEWLGYSLQGSNYVSHISVSWDGSCNGLQNFSAMLKDEVGGKATNLIPSDTPSDIYAEVARAATLIVEGFALNKVEEAVHWRGKITRGIAKRPTMTLPYGAGRYGFSDQIIAELDKLNEGKSEPYLQGDDFRNATFLAGVMEDAIGNVVVKAKEAMDWLKEVAKIAAKGGLPIHWTTPSGFLVAQDYRKQIGNRVDTVICGVRTKLMLQVESDELDSRKQAQGIAPNFVHSLDASHLVLTIDRCVDDGITSLAMIHDSYGTHAADAERLSVNLREAFIDQYSGDVLAGFIENLRTQLPPELMDELPKPPTSGTLDLEGVRDSKYFFA
ncbi:hypothetical protein A7981_05520 [Methylovorus sp. MM2]|uniref:DNA-directed RNA polymerase n=1 Tax=Methylovorus sp. MM2 TaxID=1848038 RepID=UPI0007E1CCB8|nr:DNA-directed RNA polymerase [Methylovorus sp. MM2]OAM52897.1 hypothetical protein A7981_05520 [Methylovorus sp. MM2]